MSKSTTSPEQGEPRVEEDCNESAVVTRADVLVRIPKHSSALSHPCCLERLLCQPPSFESAKRFQESKRSIDTSWSPTSKIHLELRCHHTGVLWRGLFPMLFASLEENNWETTIRQGDIECMNDDKDAIIASKRGNFNRPSKAIPLPQNTLQGLGIQDAIKVYHTTMIQYIRNFETTGVANENSADEDCAQEEIFFERNVQLPLTLPPYNSSDNIDNLNEKGASDSSSAYKISVVLWIFPPLTPPSDIDRTPFADIVSRIQRKISIQNAWNAWLSTLGGGYFGIKNLEKSLWLARQQRNLAIWLGDTKMARQSTLNEAYNWMYSGRFQLARSILDKLENEIAETRSSFSATEDDKFLERCSTARICLRRLKKLSEKGLGKYHQEQRQSRKIRTRDEFHRFRIVSC